MIELYAFMAFVALCYVVYRVMKIHPADWTQLKESTEGSWALTVLTIVVVLILAVVLWPVLLIYLLWGWLHV